MADTNILLSSVSFSFVNNDGVWTVEGSLWMDETFVSIYDAMKGYIAAVAADEKTPDVEGELYYLHLGELDFNSAVQLAVSEGNYGVACELVEAMIVLGVEVVGRMEVEEEGPPFFVARARTWNAMF